MSEFGLADLTLDGYVAQIKNRQQSDTNLNLAKDESFTTESGLIAHLLSFNFEGVNLTTYQARLVEDNSVFTISFIIPSNLSEELEPLILYSLRSIDIR